jgi:putative chitinase
MNLTEVDYKQLGVKSSGKYLPWLNKYMAEFGINTPNRIISFLMNLLHESGDFRHSREIASGEAYEFNKNLGNTQKGDGPRYKGTGISQLTGRWNFWAFTQWCKKNIPGFSEDFIKTPEKVQEPQWSVLSAIWYWQFKKCESYADRGEFREVASLWNTGKPDSITINGWADRELKREKIERWITNLVLAADS